ncbi:hypothetical protein IVB16_32265 [Bradyrhizobium sp. 183]|uniref:hypothetical protein n=1 Tax=unclassified Bradyrhizobium TaxID=2631580 RepID=UPI001FFE7F4D|nr:MULTISPECIES: hypothetical protein [unclassified Bradyrhizobium]UPJ79365.1 hypothetical protein IVB17_32265 [Bradyrhizobium sp. 184]UPJ87159.1 hypothetical protein IVB16_32265 [Bradyrhizobium sp. 183]
MDKLGFELQPMADFVLKKINQGRLTRRNSAPSAIAQPRFLMQLFRVSGPFLQRFGLNSC